MRSFRAKLRSENEKRGAERKEISVWKRKGCPAPPPHCIKQRNLRRYARRHGLRVLVETGTYMGDMVAAMKPYFDTIYSIELGKELFDRACERFSQDAHVELIHGDSGDKLREIMERLERPAIFWLDGHYSAGITAKGKSETPILEELSQIFAVHDLGHVIVVDDARLFGTDPSYPTVEELREFIRSKGRKARISVKDDSIIISPYGSLLTTARSISRNFLPFAAITFVSKLS